MATTTKIQVTKPGYDRVREIDSDMLPNFEAAGFSVVPPTPVSKTPTVSANTSITPVVTATGAIEDLNKKRAGFQGIVTGMESQAMANQVAKNQATTLATENDRFASENALKQKEVDAKTASTSALGKMEEYMNSPISDSRSRAVLGLVEQGVTGVNQLINALNMTDDGEVIGDFTPEEVKKILSSATGTKDSKGRILSGGKYVDTAESKSAMHNATTGTTGTTPSGPLTFSEQMQEINRQTDEAFIQYKKDMESLRNGTFPLSASDQAQIDQVIKTFDRLREKQLVANQNYEKGITQLGIASGRSRYATGLELGNIKQAVDDGIEKITDIEIKAASAVSELRQAFEDRDYERINDEYTALTGYLEKKSKTLSEINKAAQEEAKLLQEEQDRKLDNIKKDLDIKKLRQDVIQGNLDSFVGSLVDLDEMGNVTMVDDAILEQIAEETGIPLAQLAGSVRDKSMELSKLSQEERKREIDIANAQRQMIPQLFQEYDEAVSRGFKGSPTDWLAEKSLAGESPLDREEQRLRVQKLQNDISGGSGLNEKQTQNFLRITDKFQADEVIKAGNKGYTAIKIADQVLEDPDNAGNQLKILYTLVKNLDPDSAVREGELSLASQTQSFLEKQAANLQRLSEGKVLGKTATKELAEATKSLAQLWFDAAKNKEKQYKSQSTVAGIGEAFDEYLGGFDQLYKKEEAVQEWNNFYKNSNDKPQIEKMMSDPNLGATVEERRKGIMEFFNSDFSGDLSTSQKGSNIAKIASAIGQFETGGDYTKRGPIVTSGMYKGERALGKYQIMPGNLPSWSKEALGRVVTEEKFMKDPKIQDKIAQYKMKQYFDQHGTVEDVASMWFSGRPVAKAGNAKDVLGTSVPQYVKNIVANYNKMG